MNKKTSDNLASDNLASNNLTPTNLEKPVWGAPERNKHPILDVLKQYIQHRQFALEVGSGTGQHAVHFAKNLPHILWQCTDQMPYLSGIQQWVDDANLSNLPPPMCFNVNADVPNFRNYVNPFGKFDIIYTANTFHIMHWDTVKRFFGSISTLLLPDARVFIYGPFNHQGQFTSQSNAEFDARLKEEDPKMGIRDFEAVIELAKTFNLSLIDDVDMPANNRCLILYLQL